MTLAEFKARLTPGTKVLHLRSTARGEINQTYTVRNATTRAIRFSRTEGDDLWLTIPKAKDLQADDNGFTVTYATGTSTYAWIN